MANVNFNEVDNYVNQSKGNNFFNLVNDGETARVRFLFNSGADLEILSCHEMNIAGKRRKVNCIRSSYNSPVDECPLCASGNKPSVKYYIPLFRYTQDANGNIVGSLEVWERGSGFKSKIQELLSRFPNLSSYVFDVVRRGEKGSMKTDYSIWPLSQEEFVNYPMPTQEELESKPEALGSIVADKPFADIQYAMQYGQFPPTDNNSNGGQVTGQRPAYQAPAQQQYQPPISQNFGGPMAPPAGTFNQPYQAPAQQTPASQAPNTAVGSMTPPTPPTGPYTGIPTGGRRS